MGWIIPPPKRPTKTKEEFLIKRREKVEWLVKQGFLKSERIKRAMLTVPREEYVPEEYRDYAYYGTTFDLEVPLPIPGREATISCPHSYPLFYEALELKENEKFFINYQDYTNKGQNKFLSFYREIGLDVSLSYLNSYFPDDFESPDKTVSASQLVKFDKNFPDVIDKLTEKQKHKKQLLKKTTRVVGNLRNEEKALKENVMELRNLLAQSSIAYYQERLRELFGARLDAYLISTHAGRLMEKKNVESQWGNSKKSPVMQHEIEQVPCSYKVHGQARFGFFHTPDLEEIIHLYRY